MAFTSPLTGAHLAGSSHHNWSPYYNQIAHDHPEFEIIFVSADKSPTHGTLMRESGMPWPAIEYGKARPCPACKNTAWQGIPDPVVSMPRQSFGRQLFRRPNTWARESP